MQNEIPPNLCRCSSIKAIRFETYVKQDTSIFYLLHCYLICICVTECTSFLAEQSSSSN